MKRNWNIGIIDTVFNLQVGAMIVLYYVLIVSVFLQVIARYILKISIMWTIDLALLSFSWLVFLSASYGVKENSHFVLDIIENLLPKKILQVVNIVVSLLIFIVIIFIIVEGYKYTQRSFFSWSSALGIRNAWIISSIPVSGILMLIYWVDNFLSFFKDKERRGIIN